MRVAFLATFLFLDQDVALFDGYPYSGGRMVKPFWTRMQIWS
jgi:hypothetical protein